MLLNTKKHNLNELRKKIYDYIFKEINIDYLIYDAPLSIVFWFFIFYPFVFCSFLCFILKILFKIL